MGGDGSAGARAAVTAVVLAGGRSSRFGSDKLAAPLRGGTVLGRLVTSLPADWAVVGVGAARDVGREVAWTVEDPPGSGPLAALLAGVSAARTPVVAVVAGDMPDAADALVRLTAVLASAPAGVAGVVGVDDEGVANPLLSVWRTRAVLAARPGWAAGAPARSVLDLPHVQEPVRGLAARDVDTPADLAALEDGA